MKDNTNTVTYTSYLISLKEKEFNSESVIGRTDNKEDIEGYKLTKKIIKKEKLKNEIQDYDDYLDMLYSLFDGKVDAIFVPSNYITLFSSEEGFEEVENQTKVVYKYSEKAKIDSRALKNNKNFNEPLTFLIMGVDSTINGLDANAAFNGDTLMLLTFNPSTFEVLMVSIPRDTYVPIVCNNNRHAKINSAAAYGTDCVINTVSKFLDVDIDYYVKINFKGVVSLVDALGGVEVDVEAPTYGANTYGGKMCEQNSNREFGDKLVCVKPGYQKLNGEQALAYARNRHMYIGSDLDRIRHQQQVVEAIANKLINFKSITEFQKIFGAISKNIATDMDKNNILSGYNVVKEMAVNALSGKEFLNMQKAYLETYSLPVFLPSTGSYTSAQGFYEDSLNDIKDAINVTLDKKSKKAIKTFSFSVNEEYKLYQPGLGKRGSESLGLMPNLIGSSISKAEEFCTKNHIKLNIEYVNPGEAHYNSTASAGVIGDQSVSIGTLINTITSLTVYVPNQIVDTTQSSNDTKQNNSTQNENNEIVNPPSNSKQDNKEEDQNQTVDPNIPGMPDDEEGNN